jgi:hypothetical protein
MLWMDHLQVLKWIIQVCYMQDYVFMDGSYKGWTWTCVWMDHIRDGLGPKCMAMLLGLNNSLSTRQRNKYVSDRGN